MSKLKNLNLQRSGAAQRMRRAIGSGQDIPLESPDKLLDRLRKMADNTVGGVDEEKIKGKLGTRLKDYLGADELLNFSWLFITSVYADSYRKECAEHGNMTKEEHKYLKLASTYLDKFTREVLNRLSKEQQERVFSKLSGCAVKFFDSETLGKFSKSVQDIMQTVVLDRYDAETFMEVAYRQMCKNCTASHAGCELHHISVELFMPESGHNLPNCPYAYAESEIPNEQKLSHQIIYLEEIRKERMKSMEDTKQPALRDLFNAEIDALNKAIEVMTSLKNKDGGEKNEKDSKDQG